MIQKKKKKSKLPLILILLAAAITLIIYFSTKSNTPSKNSAIDNKENIETNVRVLEDGTKLNTSNKVNKTRKINELEITNIRLTYKNGISRILADVKNTSNNSIDVTEVLITLYDVEGKVIDELEGIIGKLESGKSTVLNVGASSDYSEADDLKIEKK